MHALIQLQQKLPLILFAGLLASQHLAMAGTDQAMQEELLKARVKNQSQTNEHAAHVQQDETMGFHGVFYGYLPCQDCQGVKTTLSLKQNNNYLVVTQQAKASSREFYEKGKYHWDQQTNQLSLIPSKAAPKRLFRIADDSTLIQLNEDGMPMLGNQADYELHRSDTIKSRQVHIH